MMTCWKCGNECADNQVECEKCMNVTVTHSPGVRARPIDWNKVSTFDDLKKIMRYTGWGVYINSDAERALKEFLID